MQGTFVQDRMTHRLFRNKFNGTRFYETNDRLSCAALTSYLNTAHSALTNSTAKFISGGGEMGELTRNYDWSNHPLGPIENWSQSLKTTLGIVLHSAFPMCLFWGDDLICFYNDAYRSSLGDPGKLPALGKPGREGWPERWDFIGPQIEKVVTTGEPTWLEDQLQCVLSEGKVEDTYWTSSYSPVYGDSGTIDGILLTCTQTTEKVVSVKNLEEAKQRFQTLVSQATVATIVLIGPEKVVDIVNDAYGRMIGRTTGELLGKKLFDVIPEAREPFEKIIDDVRDTGNSRYLYEQPYTVYDKEGKSLQGYIDLVYKPYLNKVNEIAGVMILCQDVTENVNVRRKIQESEERFEAAVEAVQGVVWTNSADGRMVGEQPGWSALTGQTQEEYEGYGWSNAVHPDDAQASVEVWEEAVREVKPYVFQHRLKVKNGTYRIFSIRAIPLKNSDGSIREWVGVHTDITEHHLAEAILKESEQRFRNLADHAPMFIWMVDENGVITYANRELLKFIGVTSENEVTTSGGWERVTHPDDLPAVYAAFMEGLQARREYIVEARLRNSATYDYEWFLFKAAPRILANGAFTGFIGTAVNIHQQKVLLAEMEARVQLRTRELNAANEALVQSNDDLKQFAHVASHDLKEPVRKIQTFGHRLLDEFSAELAPRARLYLQKIIRSAERMNSMIDGVLTYSSMTASEAKIEQVNLNEVFDNITGDLEVLVSKKSARIVKDDLPTIEGSEVLLYQLFYNLINNSLKFSRPDVPVVVTIESKDAEDHVIIRITDNGIGFDPLYAERIFDSFTRLNTKDQFEGTGLGLSLCRKIVQRHNGSIDAHGVPGKGAAFRIRLPKRQKA